MPDVITTELVCSLVQDTVHGADQAAVLPGLRNKVSTAYLLTDSQRSPLGVTRGDEWAKIAVGQTASAIAAALKERK